MPTVWQFPGLSESACRDTPGTCMMDAVGMRLPSPRPASGRHHLSQAQCPHHLTVILHWLGIMFDPAIAGYRGSEEVPLSPLSLIRENAVKADGLDVSLPDPSHEIALRTVLPEGVRLYSGDDFNYPELIDCDGIHHSGALLGTSEGICPVAALPDIPGAILEAVAPDARELFLVVGGLPGGGEGRGGCPPARCSGPPPRHAPAGA